MTLSNCAWALTIGPFNYSIMTNYKRIFANTLTLYLRLLVTMGISLYTSRVILSILGETDFGIFNVVGGVVILFSFITSALTSSTQRFLNYHIEKTDNDYIIELFSTCTLAHFIIAIVIVLLGETIGLWFVQTQLNIPIERTTAALWVYQMTLLSTIFNVIVVPYRASIIASEKMSIFAILSVAESVLRLLIVFALPFIGNDNLIIYSILFAGISICIFLCYRVLARHKLSFCKFTPLWDKKMLADVLSFSGWYLVGGVAMVGSKQGVNIILNIAFNVTLNAASGIANQVRGAVYNFASSFQTAFNPQLVKLYALEEHNELLTLINRSTRYSFFLIFLIAYPIFIWSGEILHYWLTIVPEYTAIFTRLVLVSAIIEALSVPLWTTIGATGKIKNYHLIVSLILISDLPLVYFAFKMGYAPPSAFLIVSIVDMLAFMYRLLYLDKLINIDLKRYFKEAILPCARVLLGSALPALLLFNYFECVRISVGWLISSIVASLIIVLAVIFLLGFSRIERLVFLDAIKKGVIKIR